MTVFTVTYTDGSIEEYRHPTQDRLAEGALTMVWGDKTVTIPLTSIRKIEVYEEA